MMPAPFSPVVSVGMRLLGSTRPELDQIEVFSLFVARVSGGPET